MKEKLAIFDLDGTLFDTCYANYFSYNEAIKQLGYEEVDFERFRAEAFGKSYKRFLPQFIQGISDREMKKIHDIKTKIYIDQALDKCVKNEGLFDIIDGVSDTYYIALVTTASRECVNAILACNNVAEKFDVIISGDDVEKPKPDMEGYMKVVEQFGVRKENVIVFEDDPQCVETIRNENITVMQVY